ncbi:MAG: response regulator [Bradyrhizobium sp.]|uniref:response regulator n=1 Tax=Bradyrhizobium sp. TaxID=376 RepID=UPI0025C42709|nr:response regulator [Bradyrhizobium sp.]MBI5263494.1 response regulator [Bradyrhizobium sp.]
MVVGNRSDSLVNVYGCRVLIIEDEYFLADELDKELKSHGAKIVGPVGDVREAQDQIAVGEFDVAILDVNLRNEFAWPVADELMRRQIPFALATGYGVEAIPRRFWNIMRWEKPWELAEVINSVGQLWRRQSGRGFRD